MIYQHKSFLFFIVFLIFISCITKAIAYNNPLSVVFKAQVPPGEWANTNNCGQTSALMVMCYHKNTIPTEQGIKDIDTWLYQNEGDLINNYNELVQRLEHLEDNIKD